MGSALLLDTRLGTRLGSLAGLQAAMRVPEADAQELALMLSDDDGYDDEEEEQQQQQTPQRDVRADSVVAVIERMEAISAPADECVASLRTIQTSR